MLSIDTCQSGLPVPFPSLSLSLSLSKLTEYEDGDMRDLTAASQGNTYSSMKPTQLKKKKKDGKKAIRSALCQQWRTRCVYADSMVIVIFLSIRLHEHRTEGAGSGKCVLCSCVDALSWIALSRS